MAGIFATMAVIGLISVSFVLFGFSLVKKYNKPNTKLFHDLTGGQYIGIVFILIGLIPFIQYFFQGMLFGAGNYAFDSISNEF
jgi:hypothetical protein